MNKKIISVLQAIRNHFSIFFRDSGTAKSYYTNSKIVFTSREKRNNSSQSHSVNRLFLSDIFQRSEKKHWIDKVIGVWWY